MKASSLAFATALLAVLRVDPALATPSAMTASADATWATAAATIPTVQAAYRRNSFADIVTIEYTATGRTTFAPVANNGSAPGGPGPAYSLPDTVSITNRNVAFAHAEPGKLDAASSGWSKSGGTSVYAGTSLGWALQDGAAGVSASQRYDVSPAGPKISGATGAVYIPNPGSSPRSGSRTRTGLSGSVQPSGLNPSQAPGLATTNLWKDPNSRSDLTIEAYAITEADPASLTAGSVVHAGGTLRIPVTIVGAGPGDLTATLTIFSNQGSSVGSGGETFSYLLNPLVVTSLSLTPAPEPASLALLGAGLAGLASFRRRSTR